MLAGCRFGFESGRDAAPARDTTSGFDAATGFDATDALVVTPDGPVEFDVTMCPASYTITLPSSSHRYRVVTSLMKWTDAIGTCNADQVSAAAPTHMVTLASDTERAELAAVVVLIWIGMSDRRTEGVYLPVTLENVTGYPVTGSPPWGPGEPNNNLGGEDCVQIANNGLLNDFGCGIKMAFACECDPHLDAPARY